MVQGAAGRALAIALATLVMFMLLFLREATSPSGEGYWPAMAAAPDGGLYLADEVRHELRVISPAGSDRVLAPLPPAIYRALAADGANLLLAGEGHLYVSNDTGRTWRPTLSGRFTAVSIRGNQALAGAWGDALWHSDDAGGSWARAEIPAGDNEFEAVIPGYAATLLGLLRSRDGGRTWEHDAALPNRTTSISEEPVLEVGDWRGTVWRQVDGAEGWNAREHYGGGVTSLAGDLVATTGGLFFQSRRASGVLGSGEVSRLVASGTGYFAALARGPIFHSADGNSWRAVHQN